MLSVLTKFEADKYVPASIGHISIFFFIKFAHCITVSRKYELHVYTENHLVTILNQFPRVSSRGNFFVQDACWLSKLLDEISHTNTTMSIKKKGSLYILLYIASLLRCYLLHYDSVDQRIICVNIIFFLPVQYARHVTLTRQTFQFKRTWQWPFWKIKK